MVKGYEVAKDEYVQIPQEELDSLRATESDAMTIVECAARGRHSNV